MTPNKESVFQTMFASPKEEPYFGTIEFKKRTLCFSNTIILRQNISRVEKYNIDRVHRIPTGALVLFAVVAIAGFFFIPIGLIFTLISLIPVIMGIKERLKPRLTGLTFNLNSGYAHTFFSTDKEGIKNLFSRTLDALEKEEVFSVDFHKNGKIEIMNINNSTIQIAGDHSTNQSSGANSINQNAGDHSTQNASVHGSNVETNNLTSLNNVLEKHGVSVADIQELNAILKTEMPNNAQQRIGDKASKWVSKIAASGLAVTEKLLVQFITDYYGWNK